MIFITTNMIVSLRFIMRNSKGEVLENHMQSPPVLYLHGGAAILPALQKQLEGMVQGEKKIIELTAVRDKSPGDFVFELVIDDVREASNAEIALGYPVVISDNTCGEDCGCYKYHED